MTKNERLLHANDICELYGLSKYETQTMMNNIKKINIGRGNQRPRWVVRQSDVEAYLLNRQSKDNVYGLDKIGRILRRR